MNWTIYQSLLKLMSIELIIPPNSLILCHLLLLLPSIFPSIRSLPMSRLFPSGGQSIAASASVLPNNIQSGFPLGLIDLLVSKRLSRVFSSTTIWKHQFFGTQTSLWSSSHIMYMITGKTIALNIWPFVSKVTSLLSNTLSGFVIAFLPRRKCLLISWLQSPSAGISETKKMKCDTASTFSPSVCHEVMGQMPWSSFHEVKVSFKPRFLPLLPLSSRSSLVPHKFLPLKWYHLHI